MSGPGDSQEVRLMIGVAWTVWGETPSRALIIVYSVRMFAVPLVLTPRKEWPCGCGFPGSSCLPHGGGGGVVVRSPFLPYQT
jgi:hypothetical protein